MLESSERDPVEVLAEEFVERHRRGERPSLTEYVSRRPDQADAIRALFPALIVMEDLKPVGELVASSDARDEVVKEPLPQQLGDYRILREIGRGGMGVVYEAEQVSLGRHVALKVLPAHGLMGPTYLERFRHEAKAAAKLHHTNIVPVFNVGEADGVHFYAMQFIRGEALDKVLHDVRHLRQRHGGTAGDEATTASAFSKSVAHGLVTGSFAAAAPTQMPMATATGDPRSLTESGGSITGLSSASRTDAEYFRSVARLGLQASEGLAYAHKQGVLHRDVKPSNLLLDLEGTVWITDFGLAKAEGADELTHAGDIVGTIRFMAPERFDGQSLPQSDIYSLGITLYEMLTLRPAFDAVERNRLIKRVIHDEPARPRSLNRAVPRDLETIVLKAIAKDPAHRYATAAELADDLRRFADDRPIRARRVSEFEKAWRWCRRNPLAAASAGLAAALVTLLAVGLPLGLMLRGERNRAVVYLERAEENLGRAERAEREIRLRSHLAQARAFRHSGQPGQRFSCLEELAKAAALSPSPELMGELRDEAVAAQALVDLRPARTWEVSSPTNFVMFDASFERYAWWERNGPIHIVQTSNQQNERKLTALGTLSEGVYFSPDGRYLCAPYTFLGRRISWLWPLATSTAPVMLVGEVKAFSPDGRLVLTWVSLADGEVRIFEVDTAREVARFLVGPGWHSFAFHPESRLLAVSQDGPLQVWDTTTGSMVRTVPGITGRQVIAWHPRGGYLAGGGTERESVIRVWDTTASRLQAEMRVPTERITGLQFNHAGDLLLSTGWDETYRLWDPMTGRQHLAVGGGGGKQASFSPDDGMIAYTRTGAKITLWELARANVERHVVGPRSFGGVYSAQLSPDGRLVCLGGRGLVLWDRQQCRELTFVADVEHGVIDPKGESLLTAGRAGLHRWPITSSAADAGATRRTVRIGPPEPLTELQSCASISLASDGRTVAAVVRERFEALIVNLENPERVVTTARHEGMATVAMSANGRWLASGVYRSGGAGCTKIWDAHTGAWVCDLPHHLAAGDATVLFSPDGRWLITANPQVYRFWHVGSWEPGPSIEREQGGSIAGSMAFSSDGRLLAIARTGTQVQLVDARDASKLANLEVSDPYLISSLAFSRDGATLVVGRDNRTIHVWDLRAIRIQLSKLGLDWGLPAYAPAAGSESAPIQFEVRSSRSVRLENPVEAKKRVESYSKRLAANSEDVEAYHNRAHAYEVLGDYRKAVADFDEAIHRKSGNAHFHAHRGKGFLALKDYRGAVNDWARSLDLKPDQPEICNDLAWLLVAGPDNMRDVKRALALAERAVKLQPEDARSLNTLGVARYRNGDARDAVLVLEKSLAMSHGQQDAFDLYFLAMCHATLDEPVKAKDCFDRAVRWHEERGKSLDASHQRELLDFRAEAEKLCLPKP